jgi:hypothetical protein
MCTSIIAIAYRVLNAWRVGQCGRNSRNCMIAWCDAPFMDFRSLQQQINTTIGDR